MMVDDIDTPKLEGPQAALERMLLDEYLKTRGIASMKDLCKLTDEEAKRLMIEACKYATARLAEMECRVGFQRTIHGSS